MANGTSVDWLRMPTMVINGIFMLHFRKFKQRPTKSMRHKYSMNPIHATKMAQKCFSEQKTLLQ